MAETLTYPSPSEVAAATTLATVGALPLGQAPEAVGDGSEPAELVERRRLYYALGAMGGAAIGGGLVGFVSSSDARGAATGSLLTLGLASVANGVHILKKTDSKRLGSVLGVVGLIGIGAAIFLSGRRQESR